MKKIIIALFALLAVFACTRNEFDLQPSVQEKDNTPMSFNLSVNVMSERPETKASLKADWNDGDVVYIFFDAIPTKYLKKTFDGSAWSEEYPGGAFVAGDFSESGPAASRNMTAVWFPQGEVDVTYASSKFSFTIGGEKIYSHYMSVHAGYTIDGTTVTGTLNMEKPSGFVQFFVPGIAVGDAPAYRLMESHLTPKACDYVALAGGVTESALTAGYSLKGMAFTTDGSVTGALFGGYLSSAGTTTSYKFSLVKGVSADKPAAEGTYTLWGYRNITAGTSMTFPTIASGAWGEMSPFVYLGFGDIQWATGNLKDDGTIVSPLLAGDYYQWGATAVYGASGDECYSATEELPASRDIASLRTSGAWHMPSKAQFDALTSNTQKSWATIESTAGKLITSKVNGISLFFAATGEYDSGSLQHVGDYGRYWSTTPEGSGYANYLILSDWHFGTNDDLRTWGMQVRPITGAPTPAPAPWDGNLSSLDGTEPSGFTTATNGMTITGTLNVNVKVSIDPGATVTLDGITINGVNNSSYQWAGLTCLGDATIILKDGTTNNVKGFFPQYPGIFVPEGKTLTIQGTGSLNASSNGVGAGIGGGSNINSGNIVIQGGTITATGSGAAAGIGSGREASGGTITITGGTITANGGGGAAGIGCGSYSICGAITISGGTITANGGDYSPGIGCGYTGSSACGNITITTGVTSVTAMKGAYAPNSIGAGSGGSCGTVTIGGVVTGNITTSPFVYKVAAAATAGDLGKVIGRNGFIYNDATAATAAGTTAVATITYVGSATGEFSPYNHGLAMALSNANSDNTCQWASSEGDDDHTYQASSDSFAAESGLQYNATHNSNLYPAFKAAIANNNTVSPTGCSAWFLPTGYQLKQMISAAGSFDAFSSRINMTAGFWSSTERSGEKAWFLRIDGLWGTTGKETSPRNVRSALAF